MNSITRITIVRHGQTNFNLENRYAGFIDVPLNESGMKEAKQAANKLVDHEFEIVITSKLKRATQTAELLIGGRNIEFLQTELCNERNYGKMQGLTYNEVENLKPRIRYFKLNNDFHSLNPPDGETFNALRKRARQFYQLIFQEYSGKNILIVSSSAFLQQLYGIFHGLNSMESLRYNIHNLDCITYIFEGKHLIDGLTLKLLEENEQKSN